MIVVFKILGKMTKEWWLKMAESEGDSEVGAGRIYSRDGDHIVIGKPSPLAADFVATIDTPLVQEYYEADLASRITQTGFDKWLEQQLKKPGFKREYEKALKEIQEYDRRENERREAELEKKSPKKPS